MHNLRFYQVLGAIVAIIAAALLFFSVQRDAARCPGGTVYDVRSGICVMGVRP